MDKLANLIRGIRGYRKDIGDYMHRWILVTPWGALRVHRILRSDTANAWHDHPADLTMLVLGRYREFFPVAYGSECYAICTTRNNERGDATEDPWGFAPIDDHYGISEQYRDVGPFQVNRIRAETLHRIELNHGPVWSIGWMRPHRKEWGFVDRTTGHWYPWHEWIATHPDRG